MAYTRAFYLKHRAITNAAAVIHRRSARRFDARCRSAPPARSQALLEDVAHALDGHEIGDGNLHRVAIEIQRRYWSPPLAASAAINGRR
jgi:hypothetical protein